MKCDFVIDNSAGDCGKGKVVYSLLKNEKYTHCVRGNGGDNCGHTIYHNDHKFVTHNIPAGVFFGLRSIIGPGCVINPKTFMQELTELSDAGIDCKSVKIAHNAHVITEQHLCEDADDTKIGTTKRGIGQAYRDKYARTGIRAQDVPQLKEYLCDFYEEVFSASDSDTFLYEGAQGFSLDIDHGTYPFVTSSHTTLAGALLNGLSYKHIRKVFGVSKAYDTYVGAMKFQPDNNPELISIQKVGKEIGATTKRIRQCNYLNIDTLIKSLNVNGVSDLIINKMDILQQVNCWKIIVNNEIIDLTSEDNFKSYMNNIPTIVSNNIKVIYSYSEKNI